MRFPRSRRFHSLLAGAALALAAAGCNQSSQGANSKISFTPQDCGRPTSGCKFSDPIGTGGTVLVQIAGDNGTSTAGVTLNSEDTSILTVASVPDMNGKPTWKLTGVASGTTRLDAVGSDKSVVDYLDVDVVNLAGLTLEPFLGDPIGPGTDPNYDESWRVTAGQATSFYVTPLAGANKPAMGKYKYKYMLDRTIQSGLINPDPSSGYLYFKVTAAGSYVVSFDDQVGQTLSVNITAQ